jgi:hypothetical protein
MLGASALFQYNKNENWDVFDGVCLTLICLVKIKVDLDFFKATLLRKYLLNETFFEKSIFL